MTADAVAAPVEATTDVEPVRGGDAPGATIAKIGLIGGAVALYLCLVGIVPVFHARQLIAGVITLGQVALFGSMAIPGAFAARRARTTREAILAGGAAGLITGGALSLLVDRRQRRRPARDVPQCLARAVLDAHDGPRRRRARGSRRSRALLFGRLAAAASAGCPTASGRRLSAGCSPCSSWGCSRASCARR